MPQDDRGGMPATHPSTLKGSPTIITAVFGRPFQGRCPLGLLSPVTPLRRDDQGLLSDEASGFTPCAVCDRHFFMRNVP